MPQDFFVPGLPQLPINTDPKVEADLRDLYNAVRNLASQIGQFGGFEDPFPAFQNVNNIDYTAGVYKRRIYCEVTENVSYGHVLNVYDVAGVLKCRKANATAASAFPCYGINDTPGNTAAGATVAVALPGCVVSSVGGLTRGSRYFLSTIAGSIQTGIPGAPGSGIIQQAVGFAVDASKLFFMPTIHWFTA